MLVKNTQYRKYFVDCKVSSVSFQPDQDNNTSTYFCYSTYGLYENYICLSKIKNIMDLVELSRYPIKGDINCIKFVDSNSLIVSDSNGVLRLMTFDTEFHAKHEWNPAQANNKSTSNIYNFDIHEHGQIVTVTLDGSVNFFHMSEPKPIKQLSHFSSCSLWTVKFLKSPLQFLTGNNYGEVKLCDMNISECQTAKKFLLNGKLSAAKTIALNPLDENIFLVGYSDGSLQVWDIRKEISPISKLNIHTSDVNQIIFHSHQRNLVYTCSQDSKIKKIDPGMSLAYTNIFKNENITRENRWSKISAFEHEISIENLIDRDYLSINSMDILDQALIAGTDSRYLLYYNNLS